MAYTPQTRAKVRAKYIQGAPLKLAAEACKVPYNTARNWKREDAEAGHDWDIGRTARRMTKSGVEEMANEVLGELADQFLATLAAVKKDPAMPAAQRAEILVRLMDGYGKSINAASKAMPHANRLATAMDVVKFLNAFISQHYPQFRETFIAVSVAAGDDFVREFGG